MGTKKGLWVDSFRNPSRKMSEIMVVFFLKSGSVCEEPMAEPALENELVVSS